MLPRATADEDAQREVQVRANLFACPSISSFLIRIVEKSAAGGRLYGHHYTTSPHSLVLYSLAPQHMACVATDSHLRCVSNGCPLPSHKPLAVAFLRVSEMKINIWIRRSGCLNLLDHCHYKRCSSEHTLQL